jgi:hypothetical protein
MMLAQAQYAMASSNEASKDSASTDKRQAAEFLASQTH